ncbi:Predicted 6-phosphogluconolactonase (hydrolyse 6-phosphogluconolactone to 6-phosphogluconate) [Alteracholeplasma palmae J233]|uniref:Predicted 6-phosphogluconolactonase (Hydrolyse 6-phosphogluconolactone to 6-phosphogluconate) n=1 Tax=Alteracholeplasma palmae (strain ATCC 49389 / J233) TaxID=1318466 RepID=U4KK81_ALTPJ|nr:beta-propeller fold lactonase family protein [Alteracholeplasma palmae]CCV63952.1 Predicted 6-phosphogluconolactonase (hydrolyse 6-phosphogluconolactone to 6-phosphogluconate) [Alteracholeplasma palmae J233]
MKFLIGTYTKNNSLGIYEASIISDRLAKPELFLTSSNPSYLDYYDRFIFSTYSDFKEGGLSIFKDNKLLVQSIDNGKGPSHISYAKNLKMVFTANYTRGEIRTYTFKKNVLNLHETILLGDNSHAHQIYYDHKLRRVIVCDLGLDTVFVYKVSLFKKLILDYKFTLAVKSGPRHLVIHHDYHKFYIVAELSNQIFVYDYKKHELLDPYSTVADETKMGQQAAAIRLFNNDLYISNRGFENSIVHFKADKNGLTLVNSYDTHGSHPRDFSISNDGSYLVVGNLESNNICLFKRNEYGSLSFLDSIETPEPTAILFL